MRLGGIVNDLVYGLVPVNMVIRHAVGIDMILTYKLAWIMAIVKII